MPKLLFKFEFLTAWRASSNSGSFVMEKSFASLSKSCVCVDFIIYLGFFFLTFRLLTISESYLFNDWADIPFVTISFLQIFRHVFNDPFMCLLLSFLLTEIFIWNPNFSQWRQVGAWTCLIFTVPRAVFRLLLSLTSF